MTTSRSRRGAWLVLAVALAAAAAPTARAGEADVLAVEASVQPDGTFRFDVTIAHADAGWSHYADRFEILDPAGNVLGTRVLLHPHDAEQPFTRTLTGVEIPAGLVEVVVRAHDSVHGLGGIEVRVRIR